MIPRTPLLGFLTEGEPAQRLDVGQPQRRGIEHLGAQILAARQDPSHGAVRELYRRVNFRPGQHAQLLQSFEREEQGGRRRLKSFKKAPEDERDAAVQREMARQEELRRRVQRSAARISRAIRFDDTPDVGPYSSPGFPQPGHMFPREDEIGSPTQRISGREFRAHQDRLRHMNRVLHFARRSARAFGGVHQPGAEETGYFAVDFRDPHLRDAYLDHLRRNLGNTITNAIQPEDEEEGSHSVQSTHGTLWRAIKAQDAGVQEWRTPLLADLLMAASAGS